jgi:hypothetical protein
MSNNVKHLGAVKHEDIKKWRESKAVTNNKIVNR